MLTKQGVSPPHAEEAQRNVKVLTGVLMGSIKGVSQENPELKITLGQVQVALSRVYDELTRRAVSLTAQDKPASSGVLAFSA